ncbi:ImmA/IrrE family metallo-endopeptidase [Magnetococcales bacterium HHB-1]
MNTEYWNPDDWANFVNMVFDRAFGAERYPISVVKSALEFTELKYPHDPITDVRGHDLAAIEGSLVRDPHNRKGWCIFYHSGVPSRRRIRFTLAHEFGHYLMHRHQHPGGFECKIGEFGRHMGDLFQQEREADLFAAHFLMPQYDFKEQISPWEETDLNALSCCADRYGVSMTAAIRQWLRYTQIKAVLVLSSEGFIEWAEASLPAQKAGTHFPKTNVSPPLEVPEGALALTPEKTNYPKEGIPLEKGTWFPEHDVWEMVIVSLRYESVLSLLIIKD